MRSVGGLGRSAVVALVFLGLASPMAAQDGVRMLDGSLTYRDRMALPPDALVVIEARDARGRVLGEATFATRGAQVPLPFELAVPDGTDAELRAAIMVESQPIWFTTDIAISAGTEPVSLGEVTLRRFVPMGFSSTLRCDDRELRVGFHGETAVIETDGARRVLAQVPSASGARFEDPEDADTWVWSRNNRALVSIDGELLPECSVVPPDAPGRYVARGNEPGWTLTIEDGRVTLVSDYGESRVEAALPGSRYEDGGFVYEFPAQDLAIRIEPGLCRDDMTGMPYPERVTVDLGDRRLSGCGGETSEVLTGGAWIVEDIDGLGIIDASRVTLDFARDGGLGGEASCNRYATRIDIGGELVSIGQIAATRMMCPEAVMDQERRFFAALASVDRLEIDETGALLLYDSARTEPAITARR